SRASHSTSRSRTPWSSASPGRCSRHSTRARNACACWPERERRSVDEELNNSIALLLTQTRFARRALEDIERATASYGSFAFTSVIAAGKRFGEPPLFDGALKVHIVNIGDLAPGSGFGALIEGLLGGAGRFAGNLIGGIFGGAIASPILAWNLPAIERLAGRIENILRLLGIGTATTEP